MTGFVLTPWVWAAAAAGLAALEVIAPGVFLIWLGGAAAVTALLVALLAPGWEVQVVLFAALSAVSIVAARRWMHGRAPADGHTLNRRSDAMAGTLVTVVEPIIDGEGRVQIGDSPWPASGPDLAAGSRARIVRVEGTRVFVQAA